MCAGEVTSGSGVPLVTAIVEPLPPSNEAPKPISSGTAAEALAARIAPRSVQPEVPASQIACVSVSPVLSTS